MPQPEWCPRVMLSTGCDLREWSGGPVGVVVGGVVVSLPAYGLGEGVFDDIIAALCGRSAYAGQSVAEFADVELAVPIPLSVPWAASIDANDRVYLESGAAFEVLASPTWGFTDAITAAVAVGARWRATAQTDWVRGNIIPTAGDSGRIGVRAAAPDPWVYVPDLCRWQSVPVALRSSALADADQVPQAQTVQGADNLACLPLAMHVQWGVDDTGRVWRAHDRGAPAGDWIPGIVPSFEARVGAARGWTTVAGPGPLRTQIAIDPCPGVLCPSRPPAEPLTRSAEVSVSATRALSGLVRRVERAQVQSWVVQLLIDGTHDDWDDLWDHYLRRWVPYQGRRVVLYQDIGDTRRRGALQEGHVYGLLRTVQDAGRFGRVIGVLSEAHDTAQALEAQDGLYRRAPLTIRFVEVP